MAKRRGARNYKQTVTGTKTLGTTGAQYHIGKVNKLDPALKGGYIKNFVVSVVQNNSTYSVPPPDPTDNVGGTALMGAFTVYLSNSASGDWSDDQVLTARSTGSGGGTVSLSARRFIKDDENADDNSVSPVHVWLEMTDVTSGATNLTARCTIEAWGRMILLSGDFD